MKKNCKCGHCGEDLPLSEKNRVVCKACGYVNYYHSDRNSYKAYAPGSKSSSSAQLI